MRHLLLALLLPGCAHVQTQPLPPTAVAALALGATGYASTALGTLDTMPPEACATSLSLGAIATAASWAVRGLDQSFDVDLTRCGTLDELRGAEVASKVLDQAQAVAALVNGSLPAAGDACAELWRSWGDALLASTRLDLQASPGVAYVATLTGTVPAVPTCDPAKPRTRVVVTPLGLGATTLPDGSTEGPI